MLAVAAIAMGAPGRAASQMAEEPRASVIDPKQATERFVQLFDETCFRNRRAPDRLRSLAPQWGWREMTGPFPFREKDDQYTVLIGWEFWFGGAPHQVRLVQFDSVAPAVACVAMATVMHKASLPESMTDRLGLKILKSFVLNDEDMTMFETVGERDVRTVCQTPTLDQVLIGQCGVVIVPEDSSS